MDKLTPEQARHYIANFAKFTLAGAKMVKFENGDEVYFDNMTDEQAIRVAGGLMAIEAEAAALKKGKNN